MSRSFSNKPSSQLLQSAVGSDPNEAVGIAAQAARGRPQTEPSNFGEQRSENQQRRVSLAEQPHNRLHRPRDEEADDLDRDAKRSDPIAALGGSIGALGTTGAGVLWTISVLFGAMQNNIYAELSTIFPNKSGDLAVYAHDALRK